MENSGNSIIAQTKSKKKTYIIGGILFAVLLLVGAAATFWLTQQEQDVRQQASTAGQCLAPGESCPGGSHFDASCPITETRCDTSSGGGSTQPATRISDGNCLGPGERCKSGKSYFDNKCPVTEERCGTEEVVEVTKVKDGNCLQPGQVCQSNKSYFDNKCAVTETRCGTEPVVEVIKIKDGNCLIPGETCESNKSYFDGTCAVTETRCGTEPVVEVIKIKDGNCLIPGETCESGKSYFDNKCPVTETRCGTTSVRIADGKCLAPGEICESNKSYFDSTCAITETRCGTNSSGGTNLGGGSGGTSGGGVCEHISQYEKNPLQSCPADYTELSYDHCMERECVDDQMCEFWAVDCCSQLGTGEDSNTCTGQIAGFVTKKLNCEYDPACDDQPTTSPSPVIGPQCLSISMSIANPKINDSVTFTCGQVTGANEYIFRVKTPDGEIASLGKSSSRVSSPLLITQAGKYTAQCQICIGGTCKPWESLD